MIAANLIRPVMSQSCGRATAFARVEIMDEAGNILPSGETGEIVVRKGSESFFLAVGEGFVEITGDHVSVMTDMAVRAENIDEAKADEARRRAEARLAEKLDDEEAALVNAALAHSLAQLKVKRRQQR